jgi:hypothetical protein
VQSFLTLYVLGLGPGPASTKKKKQSNRERVGKFSFSNQLNGIIPLLGDKWLNENEDNTKRILKRKFWKQVQF